jgi:serine protease Do
MGSPLYCRNWIICPFAALLLIALLLSPPLRADELKPRGVPASSLRRTPAVEVVDKNEAAVVNIFSERTIALDNREKQIELMQLQQRVNGMGTGVVIDPRGYILTNHHVVDDVQMLRVRLHDGATFTARIVVREPAEDLAVIKIDVNRPLPTATFGTATDLNVGETVIAIGNAFGYEHSVTLGVVSAVKRDVVLNREVSYKSLIQTDASINPGNSGGPLFNIHGELIGINVAIRAGAQGIGFAIPVDTAMRVAADMLSAKRRTGLAHGLTVRNALDVSDNPIRRWTVVERVEPGSPADKAGFMAGDVLDKAGEQKMICTLDLERAFLDRPLGEKVAIVARRGATSKGEGGAEIRGELALRGPDKAPAALPVDLVWKKLGVKVLPAPIDQVVKANPQLHGGMLITDVNAETVAAKAGFQRGDILIGLHQWETINIDNIAYVLNHPDLATFTPVRYFRIRGGQLQRGWLPNLE